MPEEKIEITDEQGVPTDQVSTRLEAHQLGLWHRVTAIWILRGREAILTNCLGNTKDLDLRGKWSTTVGGHVAMGEDVRASAVREIKEELGVVVEPNNLTFMCERQSRGYFHIQEAFLLNWNLAPDAFTIDNDEIVNLRWLSIPEYLKEYEKGLFINTLIEPIRGYLGLKKI